MRAKASRLFITTIFLALTFCANARVYLVSVGIADYSGFPSKIKNLRLTTNDAKAIADLYSKNASVDYSLLLDEKATKDRIVRAIKKVFNMASEEDPVVFFFSGHGYPGGFCAYDGKIGYDEIRKAMSGRDRIITAKELFDFVHEGVTQISGGKQHPVMWGNFNDDMTVIKW